MSNLLRTLVWVGLLLAMALLLTTASLQLVREFQERPVHVYYCDSNGCESR